jgi:hypothetical protein
MAKWELTFCRNIFDEAFLRFGAKAARVTRGLMAHLRALLILPISSACTGTPTRAPGYSYPPARLEIKIAPEVGPREFAKYELKLTNVYDRSLWVNSFLQTASPPQPNGVEVSLEIRGPSGEARYACASNVDPPTKKDYVVLEPGESITSPGALRCFSGINVGETYTARAHYHDLNRNVPLSPPSALHLSTEIISEPVHFKIVECPPDWADAGWCDPSRPRDH